jgi:hypothetical protein
MKSLPTENADKIGCAGKYRKMGNIEISECWGSLAK